MTKYIKLGDGLGVCPEPWQRFVWSIIDEVDDVDPGSVVEQRLSDRYNAVLVDRGVSFENEAGYFMFMLEWT